MIRTVSEVLFEEFCSGNGVPWERVPEGESPAPDFVVTLTNGISAYVEIKQIEEDADFSRRNGVSSRTVGDHVRAKIIEARPQIQLGSRLGKPSILLVHNNLDPLQLFGTEQHDFLAAMYGEMTIMLKRGKVVDSFHGRNSTLRKDHNSSFSAIGHLRSANTGTAVEMYENVFARIRLDPVYVPKCFGLFRVEVVESAA